MLFKVIWRHSGKLKVVKIKMYCLSHYTSGFLNSVEELSSGQPGRVADLPNSSPISREMLGNNCSREIVTTRSVLQDLLALAVFLTSISFLSVKIIVLLIPTTKN